jgi:PHP family Zn ribbon phosphoesterase
VNRNNTEYYKADLHVHTPESLCYSSSSSTPADIVEAALSAGIQVLGITDHNSVNGIEGIREAAQGRLIIFPGVEITTPNGHFLALFDVHTTADELNEFLDSIGIEPGGRGDAHTVAADETEITLARVKERGGMTIAAHIDRWPSGFMEAKITRQQKRKIHESQYLDALEITIPENKVAWNEGKMRGLPVKRTCVQGSDAHKPEEIGRRPVYIKMEKPCIESFLHAIQNHQDCIMFPE